MNRPILIFFFRQDVSIAIRHVCLFVCWLVGSLVCLSVRAFVVLGPNISKTVGDADSFIMERL